MPKTVAPRIFVIAETCINETGLEQYLAAIGAPDWESNASSAAELLTEVAGKTCYMSFSTDLNKNLTRANTRSNHDYIQDQIIKVKHGSVLEHSTMTFAMTDVSRILTHELVRHRAGTAFSQLSGRFVRTDEIRYFVPEVVREQVPVAERIFHDAFAQMEKSVKELEEHFKIDTLSMDMKKKLTSAFRRLVGNGQANVVIFTANHRMLRNTIPVRTHRSAEDEIRRVFSMVWQACLRRCPAIYDDGEYEIIDGHPEVTFPTEHI